jgi:hypothetical protein
MVGAVLFFFGVSEFNPEATGISLILAIAIFAVGFFVLVAAYNRS